ncbi:MAG: winged helix-turn-helix domain-containing protein [Fimbriimonadaceae bacterium]|nr:winged helix-turn-helix domain-containing protein [Fimbriimonadaceae bacterium]
MKSDSVSARVVEELRRLAEEAGPGAKLPSVRDLRDSLGISHAPLDSALGHLQREGIIERRHGAGIFVRDRIGLQRCGLIVDAALLCGADFSPFWSILLRHLLGAGRASGFDVVLYLAQTDQVFSDRDAVDDSAVPVGLVNELAEGHLRGLIVLGIPQALYNYLDTFGVPISSFAGYGRHRVELAGGPVLTAAGVLAALEDGARTIRVLGSAEDLEPQTLQICRAAGVEVSLLPGGTAPTESLMHPRLSQGLAIGASCPLKDLLGASVVSSNDLRSQGFLAAIRNRGLAPARDFNFYSHANRESPILLGWEAEMVRIEVDAEEVAVGLVEMLTGQMTGRMPPEAFQTQGSLRSPGPDWTLHVGSRVIRPGGPNQRDSKQSTSG